MSRLIKSIAEYKIFQQATYRYRGIKNRVNSWHSIWKNTSDICGKFVLRIVNIFMITHVYVCNKTIVSYKPEKNILSFPNPHQSPAITLWKLFSSLHIYDCYLRTSIPTFCSQLRTSFHFILIHKATKLDIFVPLYSRFSPFTTLTNSSA